MPRGPEQRGGRHQNSQNQSRRASGPRRGRADSSVTRRNFLKWGIGGVGVTVLVGGSVYAAGEMGLFNRETSEYSGEIEETKALLDKWKKETNGKPDVFQQYVPKLVKLATRYFSKQMSTILPEKTSDYDAELLERRISILSEEEFTKRELGCDTIPPPYIDASSDKLKKLVKLNPYRTVRNSHTRGSRAYIDSFFTTVIHELLHTTTTLKVHPEPVRVASLSSNVTHETGLSPFVITYKSADGNEVCSEISDNFGTYMEEVVVENAARQLAATVGVYDLAAQQLLNTDKRYRETVLSLFGGDYKLLFTYQQHSDLDGFVSAVGEKLGGKTKEEQILKGKNYLSNSFR